MPYFTGSDPIGPNQDAVQLDDFPSSFEASMRAAAGESWASSVTPLMVDTAKLEHANQGARLDRASAETAVREAGVDLKIPDDGYTQGALDLLIQRKHDEARRQDILDRAPTGFIPNTMRFTAQLAAGIADPLNIAAAFIPGLGEERVAALLARAGESFMARSATRAGIGAVQAGIGTAALEPIVWGAHKELGDDYHMANALTDLAFGATLGGVLHVGAGALGDVLRGGAPHPAQRFTGLSVDDIRSVMAFERERGGMPVADQARALESFSPEVRRALGVGDGIEAPTHAPPEDGNQTVFRPAAGEPFRPPMSAAETVARVAPEISETAMRAAVAQFVKGRAVDVGDIVHLDPAAKPTNVGPTIDAMVADLQAKRPALLAEAGNLAEKGVIRQTRQQLREHLSQMPDSSDAAVQVRAHEIQALAGSKNMLFKTAQKQARAEIDARVADHASTAQRLQNVIDSNARAQQAVQALHELDAHVDSLIRSRPLVDMPMPTLETVRTASQRQAKPQSISIGDFFAARAEEARLAKAKSEAATPDAALAAANEQRAAADQALTELVQNLEQAGQQIDSVKAALQESLKPFDDAVADAKNLGNAVRAAALCGLRT